jgi:peptidoglycan/LPS O-acetylase OafA/YrhL
MTLLTSMSFVPAVRFGRGPLRWLTSLGVISYSFYLLHQPILLLTSGLADAAGLGLVPTVGLALVVAGGLTVAAATVFYRSIERPFLVRGSMKSVLRPDPTHINAVRVR